MRLVQFESSNGERRVGVVEGATVREVLTARSVRELALAAIEAGIKAIRAAGKPAGILTLDPAFAQRCMDWGTTFTAVGMDISLLATAARALSDRFRPQ